MGGGVGVTTLVVTCVLREPFTHLTQPRTRTRCFVPPLVESPRPPRGRHRLRGVPGETRLGLRVYVGSGRGRVWNRFCQCFRNSQKSRRGRSLNTRRSRWASSITSGLRSRWHMSKLDPALYRRSPLRVGKGGVVQRDRTEEGCLRVPGTLPRTRRE